MSNKYNNGKIYKLVSEQTDKIYIGSTCLKNLKSRLYQHRANLKEYNTDNTKYDYVTSFELVKYKDCQIILLELVNVSTKAELLIRETYYFNTMNNIVNKIAPYRTDEDKKKYHENYRENNRELINNKAKLYRENNLQKMADRDKKYYEQNKDIINQKKKEKYQKNKQIIKEKSKLYYELNKDSIKKKRNDEYQHKKHM